jgi:hypothetical protein
MKISYIVIYTLVVLYISHYVVDTCNNMNKIVVDDLTQRIEYYQAEIVDLKMQLEK